PRVSFTAGRAKYRLGPSRTRSSSSRTGARPSPPTEPGLYLAGSTLDAMSELQDVLRAIEDGRARGERMALATVVGVKGSTYRREGARLLIPAEGRPVGT